MSSQNRTTVITVGLASLVVGAMVGITLERFHGRAHAALAKGPQAAAACDKPAPSGVPTAGAGTAVWNPVQEIRNMQTEMDRLFDGMFAQNETIPAAAFKANPGYAFSVNMQDLKDRYEVHAFLPGAKAENANVTLEGNQALKVEVNSKQVETAKKGAEVANATEWGTYEETLRLPTPVKADKMKIERRTDHELVITLPKVTT